MITVRQANARGHANHGWLDTHHTFSFANYYDAQHMGFRDLRVINDDVIARGKGFGTHGHRDMEIITYVVSGALEHKDSMGTGSVLRPGDVQRMSAGSGVTHSEFNHSPDEDLRLLQIWVLPEATGIDPGYQEKHFSSEQKQGRLCPIVAPDGVDGALHINQDVKLFASILDSQEKATYSLVAERFAWVQVVTGRVEVNGVELAEGDGAAVTEETQLEFTGLDRAEFLLFDLN